MDRSEINNDLGITEHGSIESYHDNLPPKIIEQSKIKQVREKVGSIINANSVQIFMLLLILVNAIMMGLATFNFVSKNNDLDASFETTDELLLLIFSSEAVLQVFYEGPNTIRNPWILFDILIVLCSWLLSGVQVIRAVRIFRALRLVTRLKAMRDLVETLAKTLPHMAGITTLLSLIIYIFSVMFTEFFRDDKLSEPYFARLDGSLLTSFQMITFDSWAEIAREVMAVQSWAWLPFVSFILITGFMVVHLVIAVICDAIAKLDDEDMQKMNAKTIFLDLFGDDAIDADAESDCCSESDQKNGINTEIVTLCDQVVSLEIQMHKLVISNERTLHWLRQLMSEFDET